MQQPIPRVSGGKVLQDLAPHFLHPQRRDGVENEVYPRIFVCYCEIVATDGRAERLDWDIEPAVCEHNPGSMEETLCRNATPAMPQRSTQRSGEVKFCCQRPPNQRPRSQASVPSD